MYYVYILRCADDTLYTGIAADIERRMAEHFGRTERCAKYTRSHKAERLEAVWSAENRSYASKLEWRIKRQSREQKIKLIEGKANIEEIIGSAEKYSRIK